MNIVCGHRKSGEPKPCGGRSGWSTALTWLASPLAFGAAFIVMLYGLVVLRSKAQRAARDLRRLRLDFAGSRRKVDVPRGP